MQIPQPLLQSLAHLSGFDEQAFVKAHEAENKITSLRLNPFKPIQLDFELNEAVAWNDKGFYLDERPSFTLDPLFQAGCYYVQEAGSMFIEFALKHTLDLSKQLKVLDLCGAPGGKSTLVNALLNEESLLVANEFVKSRAGILAQNLSKWGTSNTVVTNNDPQRFSELNAFFDAVVVDAPCSGSGLFRKQPEAVEEWSEDSVNACAIRQQKILADVVPAIKEGGILVYSTCSYSEKENEDIVNWLITQGFEYVQLPLNKNWNIVETHAGYRFYPHLTQSEGFFCAVLRKTEQEQAPFMPKKRMSLDATKTELSALAPFLELSDNYIIKKNDQFHLLNKAASDFLIAFEKQFYFKKAGTVIGEIKGSDVVPNQELAWSLYVNKAVNTLDLDKENALRFMRKENFSAPAGSKGLVLITYKNQGLGWAKILQNRINNYLPNELRILK